jgi:hypothetical protein
VVFLHSYAPSFPPLHRSAGFGQAVLAIVSSEAHGDHGDTPMLLRMASKELLLCAGATQGDFVVSSLSSSLSTAVSERAATASSSTAATMAGEGAVSVPSAVSDEEAASYYEHLFVLPPPAAGREHPSSLSDSGWRTRVHAMNILRLLFKDAQVRGGGSLMDVFKLLFIYNIYCYSALCTACGRNRRLSACRHSCCSRWIHVFGVARAQQLGDALLRR